MDLAMTGAPHKHTTTEVTFESLMRKLGEDSADASSSEPPEEDAGDIELVFEEVPVDAPSLTQTADDDPGPAVPVGDTGLEELVREMLRPLLRTWLDANLALIVDQEARDQIAKLGGRPGR